MANRDAASNQLIDYKNNLTVSEFNYLCAFERETIVNRYFAC